MYASVAYLPLLATATVCLMTASVALFNNALGLGVNQEIAGLRFSESFIWNGDKVDKLLFLAHTPA